MIDAPLKKNVVESIETQVNDSASDEIRAAELNAGQVRLDSAVWEALRETTNMKVIVRDKPHCSRRNISRNYAADAYLNDVQTRFIFGLKSPTRLIKNSDQFQAWFAENCQKLEAKFAAVLPNAGVRDLRFAPHRYDSSQKPFGRSVLFFHALLTTMIQIHQRRKGTEEGKAAYEFLFWIDNEKCLQQAMLADAGDENLVLTRLLDYEGFPADELAFDLAAFRDRIRALFVGDSAACFTMGYTGHMMRLLSVQFPIMLEGGACKVIGFVNGTVSPDICQRCQSRMVNWVFLTNSTLDAEFPHFETIQAWGVFNVTGVDDKARELDNGIRLEQLTRLKNVFDETTEVGDLEDQLLHFRPIARRVAVQRGLDSRDAWHSAMVASVRTSNVMQRHPHHALLRLLVRFWASGVSSSGVEQTFSKQVAACGVQMQALCDSHLDDRTEILDIQSDSVDKVIKEARNEWFEVYGRVRNSGSDRATRLDKGSKRKRLTSDQHKLSENRWIKKRRMDLAAVVNSSPSAAAVEPSPATWTDGHLREVGFMANKRIARLAESILQGSAEESSISVEDLESVATHLEGKSKTDKEYFAGKKRERLRATVTAIGLERANVHTTVDASELQGYESVRDRFQLTVHADPCDATVFVVRDLANIPARILWIVILVGGTVCNWDFLAHDGRGASITYHAALASRRLVYMTDAFVEAHPRLCELIAKLMGSFAGCKWRMARDEASFRPRAAREPTVAIAFVTTAEQLSEAWSLYCDGCHMRLSNVIATIIAHDGFDASPTKSTWAIIYLVKISAILIFFSCNIC